MRFLGIIFVLFSVMTLQAQPVEFARSYFTASGNHCAWGLTQLADSGFILTGYSSPMPFSYRSFYMRTTKVGDTIWTKRYNIQSSFINALKENDTTIFLTAGFWNGLGIHVSKINLQGDTIWNKEWGYGSSCGIGRAQFDRDSSYLLSNHPECYDYGIMKIDNQGNVIWHHYANMYACTGVIPDKQNGYVSFGSTGPVVQAYDVKRLDSVGGLIWSRNLGNCPVLPSGFYYCVDAAIMPDSNYLIATNGPDWQIMKLGKDSGNIIWSKYYGVDPYTMIAVDSNHYLFMNNLHMVLIDDSGGVVWNKPTPLGSPNQVIKTSDNGFAYCGIGGQGGYNSMVLVKMDSAGNTMFTSTYEMDEIESQITISPNPATENLSISDLPFHQNENVLLQIFDANGRLVLYQSITNNSNQIDVNVASLKPGLYAIVLQSENRNVSGRFVKE